MLDLTEEELIGICLCVIDSDISSSDEDESEHEDENDDYEKTIRRTCTKPSVDSEKHDWQPVKWTEDSTERHAR